LAQNDKSPALNDNCFRRCNPACRAPRVRCSKIFILVLAAGLAAALPFPAAAIDADYRTCLPSRLHPVSAKILAAFLDGRLTEGDFRWGFHLPNSDYLPVTDCILAALDAGPNEACAPDAVRPDGSESCSWY
jgi:hypothetical protein